MICDKKPHQAYPNMEYLCILVIHINELATIIGDSVNLNRQNIKQTGNNEF